MCEYHSVWVTTEELDRAWIPMLSQCAAAASEEVFQKINMLRVLDSTCSD